MNSPLKRVLALVLAGGMPLGAAAQDHVVGPGQVEAALQAARARRERSIASLERVLESAAVSDGARRLGVEPASLRRSLAALDGAELEDLAGRVLALSQDPVAGQTSGSPPQAPTNPLRFLALIGVLLAAAIVLLLLTGTD